MRTLTTVNKNNIFRNLPGCYLVLDPGPRYFILDANDAYLEAMGKTRRIIGKPLFEAFPGNPSEADPTGMKNLKASLDQVIKTKQKHRMRIQRYDTQVKDTQSFEVRYWKPVNIPVLDHQGEIECIIHSVSDVTDKEILRQHLKMKNADVHQQINDAINTTRELQRMEISRELHDNINQLLVTSRMYIGRALHAAPDKKDVLEPGYELLGKAINEIRNISMSLLETNVEEHDLSLAVKNLLCHVESLGMVKIEKSIDLPFEDELDARFKVMVFRIIQEAVTNVIKHADAKKLYVNLKVENNQLELMVRDNGKGFDKKKITGGIGFRNIRSRVAMLDGSLNIHSVKGRGTKLMVHLPITD